MHTILLTVAYDGTDYCGWQRQDNGITVQSALEDALSKLMQTPVAVTGASRTDSGVHALGQRAVFSVERNSIPIDRLCKAAGRYMPKDIVLQAAEYVEDGFNPRFRAKNKTYIYRIYNRPMANPLIARYSWHVPYALDLEAMRRAAGHFAGRHDFAGFCAAGGSAKTTVRNIYSCGIASADGVVELSVCGDGFLYNMVRIIAGTVVRVGCGKIPAEDIPGIIQSRDRTRAGQTAPAHGLCLNRVEY